MPMRMPIISGCEVIECSYNSGNHCHARAITVGDGAHAACDTFVQLRTKGGDASADGSVGACKAIDCTFNSSLECSAPGITVGHHGGHADCTTYSPRTAAP